MRARKTQGAIASMTILNSPATRYFPVSFFAAIMGLAGLTLVAQRFVRVWAWPPLLAQALFWMVLALFAVFAALYAIKWISHRAEALKDFQHPIRINFLPTVSVGLILLSVAAFDGWPFVSYALWVAGAALQFVFTLLIVNAWITRGSFEAAQLNPAWFIPAVGNVLVPVVGVAHAHPELSWAFFGVGIVFWLMLLTLLLQRLVFQPALADKLLPTLFILIAPPAAAFLGYSKLIGTVDVFARVLYYTALFFALLMALRYKKFLTLEFSLSGWAYAFPLAALTLATIRLYEYLRLPFYQWLAWGLSALLLVLVVLLGFLSVRAIRKKTVFIAEG
jgi:tellurite resistance protein